MTHHKVIIALDYPNPDSALQFVDKIQPNACALKVGFELFVTAGPVFVEKLVTRGFKVFLDLKFHEIAEQVDDYEAITPELALKQIQQLEQKMYEFARNLEFEDAARTRDEIQRLKDFALGKPNLEAS